MTPKISTPIFGIEWEKKMKEPNADIDFIKQQIDSWIIEIDNEKRVGISITRQQLEDFLQAVRGYGHLARLQKKEKEYVEKYLKIAEYFGERFNKPHKPAIAISHMR